MKITIKRFKSILEAELELSDINVLVGGNNSGKSSIIQAIQFAVSCTQTAGEYRKIRWANGISYAIIAPDELFYSPIHDVYSLGYGNMPLVETNSKAIEIQIEDTANSGECTFILRIRRGRGRTLSLSLIGMDLWKDIVALDEPYSMYVPGLSGISFEEDFITLGGVRRAAARGDSNHIFRNVLLQLHRKSERWDEFIKTLGMVFPKISIDVSCNEETSPNVNVLVSFEDANRLPIDAMGTGILQAIQICAYVHLFQPKILLLDEPDAHLHQNNERALANMLIEMTKKTKTKVIMATHSRTLLTALKDKGKFFRVNNGIVKSEKDFDCYSTLMDLGALDDLDILDNGRCSWVVLSEDTGKDSEKALRLVFEASGLAIDSYKVYPYGGTSHIDDAIISARFICGLHPSIRVIIHIDRDGRTEKERQEIIGNINGIDPRIRCYITRHNDIEGQFCEKEHVSSVLRSIGEDANFYDEIVPALIMELREKSLEKMITNRCRLRKAHNDQGKVATEAIVDYESDPFSYIYTKSLRGRIADALQKKCSRNINLWVSSKYIIDNKLSETIHSA